jgi:hypothetical protein
LAPIAGLLFVVGAVVLALTPAGDETGETAADISRFADTHEGWMIVTLLFSLVSLLLLGSFVSGLYLRVQRLGASAEALVVLVGGIVFTVLFYLAVNIWSAPLVDVQGDKIAAAATYLAIDDIGWMTLAGAGVGAGLMAIAASLAASRAGLVPKWAGWLGLALGLVSLATVAFVGIFAWLAWIAIASVLMALERRQAA